jgi:hypothetical protein
VIRWALGGLLALALFLFAATLHQAREGARAIAESDAAIASGERSTAIARARAAAEAAAPGSPYPARGYQRLEAIARDAEGRGDEATSTAAWSAMRAAAIETRAFGIDTSAWRRLGDDGIARVGSGAPGWAGQEGHTWSEVRAASSPLKESLAKDDTPPTWRFALLAVAAAAFLAGTARLAWIGADVAALKRARVAGPLALVGLVLYLVACLQG